MRPGSFGIEPKACYVAASPDGRLSNLGAFRLAQAVARQLQSIIPKKSLRRPPARRGARALNANPDLAGSDGAIMNRRGVRALRDGVLHRRPSIGRGKDSSRETSAAAVRCGAAPHVYRALHNQLGIRPVLPENRFGYRRQPRRRRRHRRRLRFRASWRGGEYSRGFPSCHSGLGKWLHRSALGPLSRRARGERGARWVSPHTAVHHPREAVRNCTSLFMCTWYLARICPYQANSTFAQSLCARSSEDRPLLTRSPAGN